jgi:hypothetical protein
MKKSPKYKVGQRVMVKDWKNMYGIISGINKDKTYSFDYYVKFPDSREPTLDFRCCEKSMTLIDEDKLIEPVSYELHIKGFKTKDEVEAFISWYEGQAEQDITVWLQDRKYEGKDVRKYLDTDITATYPIKWQNNVASLQIKE